MVIGKIISVMFLSREVAHREHLKSSSYAQHEALGSFYEDIIDCADKLAEAYQGKGELIEDIPYMSNDKTGNISTILRGHLALINRYRARYEDDNGAVAGIFDSIEGLYLSTLYKLKFLK